MYQPLLVDHYRFPRHKGEIENPHFSSQHHNPSCGDMVQFQGIVDTNGSISRISFNGHGCVISQATASLLSERVIGATVQHALTLKVTDIISLIEIELGPTRLKCALLPLQALQQGLLSYLSGHQEIQKITITNHDR